MHFYLTLDSTGMVLGAKKLKSKLQWNWLSSSCSNILLIFLKEKKSLLTLFYSIALALRSLYLRI